MVEGVSYLYVAKGHLVSGQVKEKEVGRQFGTVMGGGGDAKVLWASFMASNGLMFKGVCW